MPLYLTAFHRVREHVLEKLAVLVNVLVKSDHLASVDKGGQVLHGYYVRGLAH